jgi:4-amino-4-deoxy-L-arabinose transferase-like glycosyltransferase
MSSPLVRRYLPLLITLAAIVLYQVDLEEEKYNADENRWIYQGVESWRHLRALQLDAPYWSEADLFWGRASPTISKFAIGIGMSGTEVSVPLPEGRPPDDILRAARRSSVILGAAGVLSFFLLVRRVAGTPRALLACALLGMSPIWVSASRRAMTDIHGVAFAVAATYFFLVSRDWARRTRGPLALAGFAGTGILLGCAVGSKFSAAGVAIGLGLFLLVETVIAPRALGCRRDAGTRLFLLGGGALMALASLAVFVGSYPYLYDDPYGKLRHVIEAWTSLREKHAAYPVGAFKTAYRPGLHSIGEVGGLLVWPESITGAFLALPVAAALRARARTLRDREDGFRSRAVVWFALLPAAVAVQFAPGRLNHLWIGWFGLMGGILASLVGGAGRPRPAGENPPPGAIPALATATLVALAFILRSTYITWARYYIYLLPACAFIAAGGLLDLLRLARMLAGRTMARGIAVAIALALLSVVAAYPLPGAAKLVSLSKSEGMSAARGAADVTAALVLLTSGAALVSGLRRPRASA